MNEATMFRNFPQIFFAVFLSAFSPLSPIFVGDLSAVDLPGAESSNNPPPREGRPNIIVMMTDDMGYSDLSCFGSEIPTPALDSLANNGIRYTQFYNCARCCPTRASLLTGLYPHQTGIGHMVTDHGLAGYDDELNRRCVTIAEVLGGAGYRCYGAGKWHVVGENHPNIWDHLPLHRGFDHYYGTWSGAGDYFDPTGFFRDLQVITKYTDPVDRGNPDNYYYTDAVAEQAADYISEHQRNHSEKPFFLYVPFTAAHWPLQVPEEEVEPFKGMYDAGYDPIRRERHRRMIEMGILDPKWGFSETVGDFENLENRAWEIRCMEVYAGMIARMDKGVALLVDRLREENLLDNTLIFYLQDNGGCAEEKGRDPMTEKILTHNATVWPPLPKDSPPPFRRFDSQTRDGRAVRYGVGVMPGGEDTFLGYGENWANVSNTPFRLYKHYSHEGGISTPLIAHWPKGIAGANRIDATPGHLIDIMATCVDLAKGEYPTAKNGVEIHPSEGVSLVPTFAHHPIERENPLYWEHEGTRAIRDGDWKLVAAGPEAPWELYNIKEDRTELKNLVGEYPELAQKLEADWIAWGERTNVLPWIFQPAFKPEFSKEPEKR